MIQNDDHMHGGHLLRFINEACDGETVEHPNTFSPTRFPFTYACDYIRAHTGRGRKEDMSRGEASALMHAYADVHFCGDTTALACSLAMRYLALNNITIQ